MRILSFVHSFPSSLSPMKGIFVLRQAQALQAAGHELCVVRIVPIAPPIGSRWRDFNRLPDAYDYEGVQVRMLRALMPPRRLGISWVADRIATRVRTAIDCFRADVVHAHTLVPIGALVVGNGSPTVVTAHGSDAYAAPLQRRDLRRAARAAVEAASAVTAVSSFVARSVTDLGGRNVRVVWNGADEATFHPSDRSVARARLEIAAKRPTVVFAGNLHAQKGLAELVSACARLRALDPLLVIAGSGPYETAIRSALAAAGIEGRLLGIVDQALVAAYFAAADVVTLPSHNEGLPSVVCEAMLAGRAVVATPVGGIPEILTDGRTGLLVPKGDSAALARALETVLTDAPLRDRLGAAAYDFARCSLTWTVNARRCVAVFEEALAHGQADQRPSLASR